VNQLVRKGFLKRAAGKARGLTVVRRPDDIVANLVAVPLVGSVAAGTPLLAEENIVGQVLVDGNTVGSGPCFALRVTGESMKDAGIRDNDVVIVRQQQLAEPGDIVVALLDGEATVKRLFIREQTIELQPENKKYHPIPIGVDTDFRILGKVVAVRRLA
jgi:repressor LexA